MEISEKVKARLAVLSAHLAVSDPVGLGQVLPEIEPWCTSAHAPHGSLKGNLTIVDERTGKKYQVPVSGYGTVKSVDLKKVYNEFVIDNLNFILLSEILMSKLLVCFT